MILSLNETELAESLLFEKKFSQKRFDEIKIVARYYIDKGFDRKELYERVKMFILSCDPTIPITSTHWDDIISSAINKAKKEPAIVIDCIEISDEEMEDIDSLKGAQLKRLYFTLLCLAKYWNCARENNDNWVTNKDGEIMRLANITNSIKRQSELYRALEESGFVHFPKKIDSTSMRIDGVKDGCAAMKVYMLKNLGYQIMARYGGPYYECENCGVITKAKNDGSGRPPKYCNTCAIKIHTMQKVSSAISNRNIYNSKC